MSSVQTAPVESKEKESEGTAPRRKRLLPLLVVAILAAGASAYFLFLRPTAPEEPAPGEVMTMEPIQVNLAEGHYLKIGIALQLTADATEVDGSKALDATIGLFSGLPLDEVSLPEQRAELKTRLAEELDEAYHGEVMEVYFTEFVTQ